MQRTAEELTNETEDEGHVSEQSEEPVSSRSSSRNSSTSKRSSPGLMPQHRYSRDVLLEISKSPLSQKIPEFLESPHFNSSSGKWDPEKWFVNRRGDKVAPTDEIRCSKRDRQDVEISLGHKRRTSDPRERVKEEKDEIILSPQRRSFGTGCHINPQSTYSKRPGSPTDVRDSDNFRETRRIGSGRIMNRERDWEHDRRDYSYGNNRNDRRDRYDQDDNEKDNRRYSNRYGRGRMRGHERIDEEEPEWFSGGPTSQSETIELVGFEDAGNDNEVRKVNKKGKRSREGSRRQSLKSEEGDSKAEPPPPVHIEKKTDKVNQPEPEPQKAASPEVSMLNGNEESKPANVNFDLDDLFKIPWLFNKESPQENADNDMGCSRFTQWFQRESPVLGHQGSENNSRRSSLHDELFTHVICGIDDSQLIPSPTPNTSDSYFAPISPALRQSPNCSIPPPHPMTDSANKNIMDMLQSAGENKLSAVNGEPTQLHNDKPPLNKSLKELEADLKRLVLGGNPSSSQDDSSPFNRLLQHMNDSSSSISMGPMDKSKVLQEDDILENIFGSRPLSPVQTESDQLKFSTSVANASGLMHPNHIQQESNQSSQNGLYNKFFQQRQEEQHRQQVPFEMQQQHLLLQQQQQMSKQNVNPPAFTVDALAKILETQPHPRLSPVPLGMPGLYYGHYDRATLNNLQRQRDIMSSMLKVDQTQKLNTAPSSLLQPQPCQNSKEVMIAPSAQTLGLPKCVGSSVGSGLAFSPRQSPLPPDVLHPQGRIPSPLIFGQKPPPLSHAPAPIHPNHLAQSRVQNSANSNTLQVQNPLVLQRVPSPQELAAHTQSILQNALIKRKLEEQKENFRKRQEAQRTNSPGLCNKSGNGSSPLKGLSPTIAAFTPTAVMRKMHSEKTENPQQKLENLQNGGNKSVGSMENMMMEQNIVKSNNVAVSASAGDGSFVSGMRGDIPHSKSGNVPRALYGQNMLNQMRSHQTVNSTGAMNSLPSQGRPIVKCGNGQSGINIFADAMRAVTASNVKQPVMQSKLMQPRNEKYPVVHIDREPSTETINKIVEQQRLLQQQQKSMALLGQQRRQNTSPMPPVHTAAAAAAFAFAPRNHNINPNVTANLVRPINITPSGIAAAPNINFPLLRTMIHTNPAAAAAMRGQIAALQQIQQLGVPENRPIQSGSRNFHQMSFQHLLNSQTQAAAQAHNAAGIGAHGDGKHLMPGKGPNNRQSPVNLTKWFGNDVLKQKMPEMPPVSHEKALRLEDIERQQQHSTVVHN